jgi:hyperosmotically inducible periplasmic protein
MKKMMLIPITCALCVSCNTDSANRNRDANDDYNRNKVEQPEPALSDWDITTMVKKKLMSDNSLSSSARMISVTTNDGVVTLIGTVKSNEESRRVERIVQDVPGVMDVDNQLCIENS